ncbi:MAG TPA: Rieske (2Fe-2S) protein [Gemmatimonadaceae bacterium]|nr:Rieske (2Fe-2S) protein [Gemmatimonadaceae bacterium]
MHGSSRRDFLRELVGGAFAFVVVKGIGGRTDKRYPIPSSDTAVIDKDESVIIMRWENRVWAFSLACPHQNTAIHWEGDEHRFQCPKHHSRYRPDGTFIEGRATRGLDRFAVRRDGESVLVNLDELYRQDENANDWSSAFVELVAPEK